MMLPSGPRDTHPRASALSDGSTVCSPYNEFVARLRRLRLSGCTADNPEEMQADGR